MNALADAIAELHRGIVDLREGLELLDLNPRKFAEVAREFFAAADGRLQTVATLLQGTVGSPDGSGKDGSTGNGLPRIEGAITPVEGSAGQPRRQHEEQGRPLVLLGPGGDFQRRYDG